MVGIECVAHAEERPEAGTGEDLDYWHNGGVLFYVNVLLIAIGGAIGSVGRYFLSSLVLRLTPFDFSFRHLCRERPCWRCGALRTG